MGNARRGDGEDVATQVLDLREALCLVDRELAAVRQGQDVVVGIVDVIGVPVIELHRPGPASFDEDVSIAGGGEARVRPRKGLEAQPSTSSTAASASSIAFAVTSLMTSTVSPRSATN